MMTIINVVRLNLDDLGGVVLQTGPTSARSNVYLGSNSLMITL